MVVCLLGLPQTNEEDAKLVENLNSLCNQNDVVSGVNNKTLCFKRRTVVSSAKDNKYNGLNGPLLPFIARLFYIFV